MAVSTLIIMGSYSTIANKLFVYLQNCYGHTHDTVRSLNSLHILPSLYFHVPPSCPGFKVPAESLIKVGLLEAWTNHLVGPSNPIGTHIWALSSRVPDFVQMFLPLLNSLVNLYSPNTSVVNGTWLPLLKGELSSLSPNIESSNLKSYIERFGQRLKL